MATLVKETGSGSASANSYASAADGDAYHDLHMYATLWTGANTATKEKALMMATRLLDANYLFYGRKLLKTQALQWPRYAVPDPDHAGGRDFLDDSEMPGDLVKATCELARELIITDRTQPPPGEGLKQIQLVGSLMATFDKLDEPGVLTAEVKKLLGKWGMRIDHAQGRLVRT